MQEEEKRLNYLESQVRELQAECEVASGRAQEAEALEANLRAKVSYFVLEADARTVEGNTLTFDLSILSPHHPQTLSSASKVQETPTTTFTLASTC